MQDMQLQDDEMPLFGDEEEEGLTPQLYTPGAWKVLVVDDDADVISITKMVFARFKFHGVGVEVVPASSASEAKQLLNSDVEIAVAYIDVVMENDHAGLDLVRYIREDLGNDELQVILRTGQPGYAPEIDVVVNYGINDYRTKTELNNVKLVTTLVAALRNYQNVMSARQAAKQQAISEAINETKSLFFAQMSHEFRTPLNGVVGICDLLLATQLQKEQRDYVRVIQSSGQHILSLVNDILDLSKVEAGKIELESIDFNVNELIGDTYKLLKPQVAKGVDFKYSLDSSVPAHLKGDPGRIKQVLQNLLSNAIKFTEHGFVIVNLSASELRQNTISLRITVRDSGVGIAADKLNDLFTAYTQEENSTTRKFGGTGLGLSICKQLAQMMGGDVVARSEKGKGTEFSVTLVLEHADGRVLTESAETESEVVDADISAKYRVLVVDDDATNRMVAQKMLERLGYQVDAVEDGLAAVEHANLHEPDLILMDCQMPGLNGFEATHQIRKIAKCSKVPIVALTGGVTADEMRHCFESGMNDFVSKPIRLEDVKAVVTKWLGLKSLL